MAETIDPKRTVNVLRCTLVVGAAALLGYVCLRLGGPPAETRLNPEASPWHGPQQANAFLHPVLYNTAGQRWGYRLILALLAAAVLIATVRPLRAALASVASLAAAPLRRLPRLRPFSNRWVGLLLLALLAVPVLPSFRKCPDFSAASAETLAHANIHFTIMLAHADRLAAGDVLFRDTTPPYGPLLPAALGAVERAWKPLHYGDVFRLLLGMELLYLLTAGYLFLRWARRRWLLAVPSLLLLLPFYYSAADLMVPPNHGPWRTLGIPTALLGLWLLRGAGAAALHGACGALATTALLINPESGAAATAGLLAFLYFRIWVPGGLGGWRMRARLVGLFALGGVAVVVAFAIFCKAALGHFPDLSGALRMFQYARLSHGGFGTYAYDGSLWPVVMFFHAAAALVYTAVGRCSGFTHSFRAAVAAVFLIWFAYFVNRPHPEYLCSFYLLYGFLLIDALRYAALLVRRPRRVYGLEAVATALLLLVAAPRVAGAIEWSWDPRDWRVKTTRWHVPLADRGKPAVAGAPLVSRLYLPPAYAAEVTQRADFLRARAGSEKRLIYFSADSYLMPRLAGVLPLQEYIDPCEALDRRSYDRLLAFIRDSGRAELYLEARDESAVVWYGKMFQVLRKDLSAHFRLARVESGWEIWERKNVDQRAAPASGNDRTRPACQPVPSRTTS